MHTQVKFSHAHMFICNINIFIKGTSLNPTEGYPSISCHWFYVAKAQSMIGDPFKEPFHKAYFYRQEAEAFKP